VEEALAYCRENNFSKIVKLIEHHQAGQRFLQQFDTLIQTDNPRVIKLLNAVKRFLERGTIAQIVLNTRDDLGTDFYAIDLKPLIPILERMGLHIKVTHVYEGISISRPDELNFCYSDNAHCKFIVSLTHPF